MKFVNSVIGLLLSTVLLFETNLVVAQNANADAAAGDQNLVLGHEIMDAQDAAFGTLYSVVLGEDVDVCWTYAQILGWNIVDAVKFFIELKWELATINVGLVIHKSPIVYKECLLIMSDIEYIDAMFTLFNKGPFTFQLQTQIVENIMFNMGDVMYQQDQAKKAMAARNYTLFGSTVARIIADVFYINPTDEDVWSDVNSLIITSESSSQKVPSSFYQALTVESGHGMDSWMKGLNTLSRVFDTVVSHNEPKIRDEKVKSKRDIANEVMSKSFNEENLVKHRLTDAAMEVSPKFKHSQEMKRAYHKEQESMNELEAVLNQFQDL